MKTVNSFPSAIAESDNRPGCDSPQSRWQLFRFARKHVLGMVFASAIALIPCFWHPRIEAGDLASHSYNAWLTSLAYQGKAPGLWVGTQNNNILFDILLLRLGSVLGFSLGERIAVCIAVLVFVWGSFSLVSAAAGRPAWFLLPLLTMLAYGWTFQMGFFNFYLSLGLSCIGLAILWRACGAEYLYPAVIAGLIWLAHPLGMAWFAATGTYVGMAKALKSSWQWVLSITALGVLFLIRLHLASQYRVSLARGHFYEFNGSDQFSLGVRYKFLSLCVILAIAGCILLHVIRIWDERPVSYFPLWLQLFVVSLLGVAILPDAIWITGYAEPVSFISSRFTLAVGVLGCCALASLRPRILMAVLTGLLALVYFTFLYRDTATIYSMEQQADTLVRQIPQGGRVIATIFPFRNSWVLVHHVVDRACIGHCFVFDNYEPASGQFRLHARADNRIVAASSEATNRMMLGIYVVKEEDLPLWQIFQCGPLEIDLCLRPLQAGPLQRFIAGPITRGRNLQNEAESNKPRPMEQAITKGVVALAQH